MEKEEGRKGQNQTIRHNSHEQMASCRLTLSLAKQSLQRPY